MGRRNGSARPTILDVADRANVSKSLVSLVMRDSSSVSEGRREAVLKAARELGYRPNELARGLVQRRTRTIGVLLSDLHNPYFAEAVDGIKDGVRSLCYETLLGTGNRGPEVEAIRTLLERQTDGIACFHRGSRPTTWTRWLRARRPCSSGAAPAGAPSTAS